MSETARLSLPYIAPLQSLKQFSYNEAMAMLDQLVQPAVLSRSETAPPASPGEGDTYIVGDGATGDWSGHDAQFACRGADAWAFMTPGEGWQAYVADTAELAIFHDGAWEGFVTNGGTGLAKLGINMLADTTHRLSVAADATLLNHDGGSHRLIVNKASLADSAGIELRSANSGRVELVLGGDDALYLKVSADGSAWLDALTVAPATGRIGLPAGQVAFPATQNPSADAHTLDDYEEGTWSPAVQFSGAATGVTYATPPAGRYTKIGRSVTVTGSFVLTSKGSSTGAATIAGLPFTSANDGIPVSVMLGYMHSLGVVSGMLTATIAANATRISLFQLSAGSSSAMSQSGFSNTTQMIFSATYDV